MIRGATVDLAEALSALAGRKVRIDEIIAALNVGRSTYYEQRDEGRLLSADNLLRLATELHLNPVELLIYCNLLDPDAVIACADTLNTARKPEGRRIFQRRLDAQPL